MYSIIPLAGPDFVNKDFVIKPLFKIESTPLIKKVLNSRLWVKNGELESQNMIFILKDIKESLECENYLKKEFLNCKIVKISSYAKGALMSSLSGVSLIEDFSQPIIFDLVDIAFDFEKEVNIEDLFKKNNDLGAILPYFKSNNMSYSYANIKDNYVLETKEKKGWNFKNTTLKEGNASAGVYFFRNLNIFLNSSADSIKKFADYNYNNNLFLCPAINSVVEQKKKVLAVKVKNIESFGLKFK